MVVTGPKCFSAIVHGLDGDHPIRRHWRDLHAIGHHAQWSAPAMQIAGRDALSLPFLPNDPYPIASGDA